MTEAIASRFKVVDIDSHIAEPEDLWTSRVSRKWGDRVPHVVQARELAGRAEVVPTAQVSRNPEDEIWIVDGKPGMPTALLAWAGHDEYWPGHPTTLARAHPASHDAAARVEWMDQTGIYAQAIFPNLGGTRQYVGIAHSEPELALECCRAYNDFLAEWCGAAPERLIAQATLPLWDVALCVTEIERCATSGHKSVIMTHQPDGYGLPWLPDPHWNPIWEASQETGLPICFHVEAARPPAIWPGFDPTSNLVKLAVQSFLGNADAIIDVILGGLCHRYPRLDFVSVESGVGYLPYLLEALDWQWINMGLHKAHPELDLLPSDYFKRQVYGSFWFEEESGLETAIERFPDNLLYETDFPHPTSISPGVFPFSEMARDNLERKFSRVPISEENLKKVLHDNAARVYHLA